jgi:hypothetical protein
MQQRRSLLMRGKAHVGVSLREQFKGPTAVICADGKMSGPSVQHGAPEGSDRRRRHKKAVGTAEAMPTATVGLDTTLGTDFQLPSAHENRRHNRLPCGPKKTCR